jgi:pyrroline-5-carboxylate reductase
VPNTLVIAGGGQMGGALVAGLLRAGWADPSALTVVEPDADRRAALAAAHPGLGVAEALEPGALGGTTDAVLAVKPALVDEVASRLADLGARRMLSIAAGVSTTQLEAVLPAEVVVVRAMPNMGALVGAGAAAVSGGSRSAEGDLDWARAILSSIGFVTTLPESQLDAATGLSGSGPAYLFLVAEALVQGGVAAGLAPEVAATLVRETIVGAGALLVDRNEPEALRAAVTSPGGTTAAGLAALEAADVRGALVAAVLAATGRARELGS